MNVENRRFAHIKRISVQCDYIYLVFCFQHDKKFGVEKVVGPFNFQILIQFRDVFQNLSTINIGLNGDKKYFRKIAPSKIKKYKSIKSLIILRPSRVAGVGTRAQHFS